MVYLAFCCLVSDRLVASYLIIANRLFPDCEQFPATLL